MRLGQRIMVDDGSCPAGQIKEVQGAQMTTSGVARTRKCVPRLGTEVRAELKAARQSYQLPYFATMPRHSAPRSRAKDSLPTLAFFAAAVITITSFSSGSTKIDWP